MFRLQYIFKALRWEYEEIKLNIVNFEKTGVLSTDTY